MLTTLSKIYIILMISLFHLMIFFFSDLEMKWTKTRIHTKNRLLVKKYMREN